MKNDKLEEKTIEKVEDFGNKIGGAKKDLWKSRGLMLEDLVTMNNLEREKYIVKNNVWKKPDYEKMVHVGTPIRVVYYIKKVRDSIPKQPIIEANAIIKGVSPEDLEKAQKCYISFVSKLRDALLSLKREEQVLSFYKDFLSDYLVNEPSSRYVSFTEDARYSIDNKLLKEIQIHSFMRYDHDIKKKQFCYTEEEKRLSQFEFFYVAKNFLKLENDGTKRCLSLSRSNRKDYFYPKDPSVFDLSKWKDDTYFVTKGRNIIGMNFNSKEEAYNYALLNATPIMNVKRNKERKQNFIPTQLRNLKRDGLDYRNGNQIKGEDMLSEFSFFGGEFGNYLNESDRLQSLNYSYDAFKDLARALRIDEKDISLGGTLSIAYGARGSGRAMAHYEPLRNVINLTKMKGAGNLAHEWGHALDDFIGISLNRNSFMSSSSRAKMSPTMLKLIETMRYDEKGMETEYYTNSKSFDSEFSKCDKGYWSSKVEMFARAFSCYVHDKLNGKSDYLCGHSESFVSETQEKVGDVEVVIAYPKGKERDKINSCFDALIKEMKEKQLLHHFDYSKEKKEVSQVAEQIEEQLSFNFGESSHDAWELEK